jgi:hypothetical protein
MKAHLFEPRIVLTGAGSHPFKNVGKRGASIRAPTSIITIP